MAEKRVSVRLAAVGGRQVRAELEGVGEAGAKGFGRLSREMEAANKRLAGFARRAGAAVAAASAAATTSLGLMVRATVESAEQIRRFAQIANATPEALQRWTAGARRVGIEQDKLADILKDVNDRVGDFLQTGGGPMADFFEKVAPRVGVTADQFRRLSGPEALQLYVDTLERAGLSQQEMTFYLEAMASDATALLPLLRDGGAEMARLGAQASALGAVLDGPAMEAMRRTQGALVALSQVGEGLRNRLAVAVAPAVEALASAFVALASEGGALRVTVDALAGNIGRIASYAAAFAGAMAGRWVAGFAAAALSVRGLATALVVLRGALIRTGIGALIVGAGELAYQFTRLVSGAGGFGEALSLLGDLAREVWERIGLGAQALGLRIAANWADIRAAVAEALQAALITVTGFASSAMNTMAGAAGAIRTLWAALPAAIGDIAFQAANALVAGVEAMLAGAARGIDGLLAGLNAGLEALGVERRIALIGELRLGRIENPFAGAAATAGTTARAAFEAAFAAEPIAVPDLGLAEAAAAARRQAAALRESVAGVAEAATAPLRSVAALREVLAAGAAETREGLGTAQAAAEGVGAALETAAESASRAGGAGRAAGNALAAAARTAEGAWAATAEAVTGAQERAGEIAQGLAQDIVGPIREALKAGELSWQSFAGVVSGIARNLANRLIETAFKPIETALVGALASIGSGALSSLFGFARGGVFAGGRELTAFARGGVVSGPTVFPFARGVGLMAEAGPEAILPLRRGRDGRLGVEVSREAPTAAPAPSTRIINVLDPSVVGDYLATPSGERAILNVIRRNRGAING